ncbi:MAG TPA: acyloxyacyl hydrolase [Burkholderiales bacterium]|nr:acyloxyacyl hydrolase [Burkholderiales bacterium]
MRKRGGRALALLLALYTAGAGAVDSVSLMAGSASKGDDANIWQVGLQWNWQKKWFTEGDWFVGGYWDATLGVLKGDSPAGGNNELANIGITPVFRLQQKSPSAVAPFFEAGLGLHFFSEKRIHAAKTFGSTYEFGSHVGIGVRFGPKHRFELGYRFRHFSNAGIKKPNPGINFNEFRLQYHF